jgi:hypothetical protein
MNHHRCHDEAENDAGADAARTKSNRSTTNATLNRLTTPAASVMVFTQHRPVTAITHQLGISSVRDTHLSVSARNTQTM